MSMGWGCPPPLIMTSDARTNGRARLGEPARQAQLGEWNASPAFIVVLAAPSAGERAHRTHIQIDHPQCVRAANGDGILSRRRPARQPLRSIGTSAVPRCTPRIDLTAHIVRFTPVRSMASVLLCRPDGRTGGRWHHRNSRAKQAVSPAPARVRPSDGVSPLHRHHPYCRRRPTPSTDR